MSHDPEWINDALGEVYADWYNYIRSSTPLLQAGYLDKLNSSLHDLFTYHPQFNERTGEIDGIFSE